MKSTGRSITLLLNSLGPSPILNHKMLSDFEDHGVRLLEWGIRLTAASDNLVD